MTIESILHYRILRSLGAGGMGEVFLAEDLKLGRKTAIKFLRDESLENDLARKRLLLEARAAATLDHPNICVIHEVHDDGERPFIVMQYVEGENLAAIIKRQALKPVEIVDLAVQMAEALVEAHAHGIIHRDIKPQNVMVTARGQVKILDFGLAKYLPQKAAVETEADTLSLLTEVGHVVGTVGYMSPEQLRGEAVDPRTDLFSLGVLLYTCATGRSPFPGGNSLEICLKVLQSEPPRPCTLNAAIPAELERIILKAMAKDLPSRYDSARDMLADLHNLKDRLHEGSAVRTQFIATDPTQSRRTGLGSLTALTSVTGQLRRKPVRVGLVIGLLLLALTAWLVLPLLRPALRQPTAEARGWYDQGTNYIREGAYYRATKALHTALDLDPTYALAHARLAEAYMEMEASEKAFAEIMAANDLADDRSGLPTLDGLYLKAIAAMVRREFSQAIGYYTEIVEQAPDEMRASAYMDLGRAYEKDEKIDRAIALYQQAAALATQSAWPLLRLAILYGRKQEFDNANAHFAKAETIYKALSNGEGEAEVFFQRGTMLNKISNVPEARAQLERARDLASQEKNTYQQVRAMLQLSTVYIEDNAELARKTAEDAIALAQLDNLRGLASNGLIDLGYTCAFLGDYDEAVRHLARAQEMARADKAARVEARASLALGSVFINKGRDQEGIEQLTQALRFYEPAGYRKETSIARAAMGRAERSLGNYQKAIEIFTQQLKDCKELGDSALEADANLSLALTVGVEQERYPEALPYIEKSYQINTSSGSPMNAAYDEMNRAAILWQLGRYMEARQSLQRAQGTAGSPQADYKALQAGLLLVSAQMALSERDLAAAEKHGRQALALAGTQYPDLTSQAKVCVGLAQALAGAPKPAVAVCEEGLAAAREIKSPRLISAAQMALAEVKLLAKDAGGAGADALQAQEECARSGRQDSEWRALLIAARARQLAGDRQQAVEYASRANDRLTTLEQKWGAEAFRTYQKRPDIKSYREQLTQLLGPKT